MDVLDQLQMDGAISAEGRNWLTYITDPFHDKDIKASGHPDGTFGSSVVSVIRASQPVSCPGALAGANWDVNFAVSPALSQPAGVASSGAIRYSDVLTTTGATNTPFDVAGIQCVAAASGTQTYGSTGAISNIDLTNPVPVTALKGACRVVACGFEVINTTADLYKQGQVITWRQPCPPFLTGKTPMKIGAGANWAQSLGGNIEYYQCLMPPASAAQAAILDGSKEYDARGGCYCVGVMNEEDNPIHRPLAVGVLQEQTILGDNDVTGQQCMLSPNTTATLGTSSVAIPYPTHFMNFNQFGAYFTGLSPQTTLQLNTIYIVECFPTSQQSDLAALASPTAGRDPVALSMYSKAMRLMPTGVPVGMNPLGEWFKEIVGEVSRFVAPGLTAMSVLHPGFGIAGTAAASLGQMFGPRVNRSTKTKNKKKKAPVAVARPPGQGESKEARRRRRERLEIEESYDRGFTEGEHGNLFNQRSNLSGLRARTLRNNADYTSVDRRPLMARRVG
jgi:hypothetical protein